MPSFNFQSKASLIILSCFRITRLQWRFISKSGSRAVANGDADEHNLVNTKVEEKKSSIKEERDVTKNTLIKSSSTMESKV